MDWSNPYVGIAFGALLSALLAYIIQRRQEENRKAATLLEHAENARTALTKQRDDERQLATKERADLQRQIDVMKESLVPLNTAFLASVARGITHSTEPTTDALVAKAIARTITSGEENDLEEALKRRVENPSPYTSRIEIEAAVMFPMILRRVATIEALGLEEPKIMVERPPLRGSQRTRRDD